MPSQTFTADGTFNVPAGVLSVTVDAKGAAGAAQGAVAGKGGRVQATVPTTPGESLAAIVGALGTGLLGGGRAALKRGATNLVVAGGGGSGGGDGGAGSQGGDGGDGGGTTAVAGANGGGPAYGRGGGAGTPTTGGAGGTGGGGVDGAAGVADTGGGGGDDAYNGGGGGDGLFGGGGGEGANGISAAGGGGGGSSYTDGTVTGVTHTQGYNTGAGELVVTWVTPPVSPALGNPPNASTHDLAAGYTFTWTPDAATPQTAFAMRRKIGAGAYEYWNVGTAAWQGSEVYNTTAVASVAFAASKWTNGNVYNWSVSTKETSGNFSPYASDFVVTASAVATVTVSTPTGTQITNRPTVSWSISDPESDPQQTYQVKVFSAAQYGAGGFDPATSTAAWNSGEVTDVPTRSVVVGVDLDNNTSFRAYVRVKTNSQYSAWTAYASFTVVLDAPAVPSIASATADVALARIALVLQGRDNLLTTNQASIETDTTGWAARTNCAIARSTAVFSNGLASLQLTSSASGTMDATTSTGASGRVVVPAKQYTALAKFRTAVSARSCRVDIYWYKSDGSASSTPSSQGSTVTDATGSWTAASVTAASPADAAFAAVAVVVLSTGGASEVHRVDDISIAPGASTTWTRGGLVAVAALRVEASDDAGVTWSPLKRLWTSPTVAVATDADGYAAAPLTAAGDQALTVYDYESVLNQQRQYRATARATV